MAQDHGSAPDRILVARISGITRRRGRWGNLTDDEKAAGAEELRVLAGDRADLLAEVAGLELGADEDSGPEYEVRAQAVAELCRMAGADEAQIPRWIEEGRRRAELRRMPPLSQPRKPPPYPSRAP